MSESASLDIFVKCLKKVPDPRSKQGLSQPFIAAMAIVFLGLLANRSTIAGIERWAKIHKSQLGQFLRFRKIGPPSDTTLTRILRKMSRLYRQGGRFFVSHGGTGDTELIFPAPACPQCLREKK